MKLANPIGRSTDEWRGKSADEPFPPRVRLRILARYGNHCAGCTRPIRPGTHFTCDHIVALINGGQNRESNGQPLCDWCNPKKNASDIAEKSKVASMKKAGYGLKQPKSPSRWPPKGSRPMHWRAQEKRTWPPPAPEPTMTTPDLATLTRLRERVEAASGPDRELDALLWLRLVNRKEPRMGEAEWLKQVTLSGFPRYTASIDAALAMVEAVLPDKSAEVFKQAVDEVLAMKMGLIFTGHTISDTLPLACILVLLRALEAQHDT